MKKAENYFYDDYYELMPFQHKKRREPIKNITIAVSIRKKAQVDERKRKKSQ